MKMRILSMVMGMQTWKILWRPTLPRNVTVSAAKSGGVMTTTSGHLHVGIENGGERKAICMSRGGTGTGVPRSEMPDTDGRKTRSDVRTTTNYLHITATDVTTVAHMEKTMIKDQGITGRTTENGGTDMVAQKVRAIMCTGPKRIRAPGAAGTNSLSIKSTVTMNNAETFKIDRVMMHRVSGP